MEEMEKPIHDYFLRFLVTFYSFMGVKLRTLRKDSPLSWLSLIISIIFPFLGFFGLNRYDPYRIRNRGVNIEELRPLYRLLLKVSFQTIYPACYWLSCFYLYFYGVRIIEALNSNLFTSIRQHSKLRSMFSFWSIVLVINISYVIFNIHYFLQMHHVPSWQEVLGQFGVYMFNSHYLFLLIIVYHFQNSTYQLLKQINVKLGETSQLSMVKLFKHNLEALEQIKRLAMWYRKTNFLLSFLILNFMVIMTFDFIMAFSTVYTLGIQVSAHFIFHILSISFYMVGLAVSTFSVRGEINQIVKQMQRKTNPDICYLSGVRGIYRVAEFKIYRRYFRLDIFQICRVDLGFLLQQALFIMAYVILICQTNV